MNIKQRITHNLLNIPGWRTNRKIVVIESDDWGSIRMPSREVYERLLKAGIRVDNCHYCSNDSIASEEDLSLLFDVLHSVKDKNGNPAVITANAIVANPDFEKIRDSGFAHYYFKRITEEIPRIAGCEKSLGMWKEGQRSGCFQLQSHGREHLNVARWMHYLNGDYPETRLAFNLGVYGLSTVITSEKRKSFLPAFDFTNKEEEIQANKIAAEGLRIFEEIFGYKSESFIAPNYVWGKSLEKTLAENGVKYLQGQMRAVYRNADGEQNKIRMRKQGGVSEMGLINLGRNALFEPSENQNKDWISECLLDVSISFRWQKPAIISSHRVNYISAINPRNRDNGLTLLSQLLKQIVQRWPDVEFMSSDKLGQLIQHSR